MKWLGLGDGTSDVIGAVLIFLPIILAVAIFGMRVNKLTWMPGLHLTNRVLGVGFSIALAATVLTFALLVTQFAPVPLGLTDAARRSPTGHLLLSSASPATKLLEGIASRDAEKMMLYLRQSLRPLSGANSNEPEATEEPPLRFPPAKPGEVHVDEAAETELLRLVNEARASEGLRPVKLDVRMRDIARQHSLDMYVQGYFAHTGLGGSTPSQRAEDANITYVVSGENLAIAPSVALTHDGLMKSPGHRRNILDPDFSRLGIGIYTGPRGLITSQEFCGGC